MNLLVLLWRFVTPLKESDAEAGLNLLREIETSGIEQTKEPDSSLALAQTFLPVILSHEKSLRRIEKSLKELIE